MNGLIAVSQFNQQAGARVVPAFEGVAGVHARRSAVNALGVFDERIVAGVVPAFLIGVFIEACRPAVGDVFRHGRARDGRQDLYCGSKR